MSALYKAYYALGLNLHIDASVADEEVGVAFYKKWSSDTELQNRLKNALNNIAENRESRFLRFLATIGEHLNEENIAVLAKKTWAVSENVGEEPFSAESVGGEPAGEDSEDEDTIVFDMRDGLWRCIYCQWEVEADNETDGHCRCLNDKRKAHFIDLSECLDYEPADSCSSEDDSTDSEPNSDDEDFIDDTETPLDGIAPDAGIQTVNLPAIYPAHKVAKLTKAAETANTAKTTMDKENVESTASSEHIEVIDAPMADGPPELPSNIIDCESGSMDM